MVEKEIDSLCNQYGLKPTNLSDLMLKVNSPDPCLEYGFSEEENSFYLPLYEELNAFSSLSEVGSDFQAYIQFVLDPEKASSEYLADFFNNPLGLKIRKAWEARGFIQRSEGPGSKGPTDTVPELSALHESSEDASFSGEPGFSGIVASLPSNEIEFAGKASDDNLCVGPDEISSVISAPDISLLSGISASQFVDLDSLIHSKLYLPDLEVQLEILKIKGITRELISQLTVFECRLSTYPKSINHIRRNLELIREAVKLANDSDYILELIRRGEGKKLEFKSTLRMNLITGKPDWNIEHAVLKTIVAYLNTDGGVLLVGVSNNGEALGIENDGFPNEDKFLLHFKQLLKEHIGLNYAPLIDYALMPVNGKKILEIECAKSDEAVFLKPDKNGEEFYIRIGPSSERLTGSKLIEYVNRRNNGKIG